jgi:hypothetical protein
VICGGLLHGPKLFPSSYCILLSLDSHKTKDLHRKSSYLFSGRFGAEAGGESGSALGAEGGGLASSALLAMGGYEGSDTWGADVDTDGEYSHAQ